MMAYPPPGGGFGFGNQYQQPYGGGYTYNNSAYNVNYAQPMLGLPMMPMMGMMMQQAPPSQQTNITYNMMFSSDAAFQDSAASALGMEADDVEVSDDEYEDEEEEEEEEEEVREKKEEVQEEMQEASETGSESC